MKLSEIAQFIWENAEIIPFGGAKGFPETGFTAGWFQHEFQRKRPGEKGWYWFLVNMNYAELRACKTPDEIASPLKGIRFSRQIEENVRVIGKGFLCQELSVDGKTVIYNGQEGNVANRLRSHYFLQNDRTGALGLNQYPELATKAWEVRFFTLNELERLPADTAGKIQTLAAHPIGRTAVETAWRATYGWPALCRH